MKYEVMLMCEVFARNEVEARRKAVDRITVKELDGVFSPGDVARRLGKERKAVKEHFVVFHLDTQNKIVNKEVVSVGTLNAALIHPREVFRSAIASNCASVIVAHNHPSGSLEPSEEDVQVTSRLKKAGELIGIQVVDHVIVTRDGYKSMVESSLM
jgi:DNA repair protein RadC